MARGHAKAETSKTDEFFSSPSFDGADNEDWLMVRPLVSMAGGPSSSRVDGLVTCAGGEATLLAFAGAVVVGPTDA